MGQKKEKLLQKRRDKYIIRTTILCLKKGMRLKYE